MEESGSLIECVLALVLLLWTHLVDCTFVGLVGLVDETVCLPTLCGFLVCWGTGTLCGAHGLCASALLALTL